jgi:hypothetical protein
VIEASTGGLDEFNRTMRGVVARLQVKTLFSIFLIFLTLSASG